MKINGYDITARNVWAYIQGTARKKWEEYESDVFNSPRHIQEQIVWREVIMNEECYKKGKCIHCKCKVPDKLYSDRECSDGCYPAIMDVRKWEQFKQYTLRNKMNIYDRKFDWETVLADMDEVDPIIFNSPICSNKASVHLGVCRAGDILKHKFEFFNPDKTKLVINHINPSCGCTTVVPESFEVDSYNHVNLEVFIDTENVRLGYHEIWITVRYNDIKRINLKIEYDLK